MENNNKIAIIGGGQTAIYAAKEIREHDQNCLITIYSEENEIPYEKPPLSKQYLKGELKDISALEQRWKGESHISIDYYDLPWEIEAYHLQEVLLEEYKND